MVSASFGWRNFTRPKPSSGPPATGRSWASRLKLGVAGPQPASAGAVSSVSAATAAARPAVRTRFPKTFMRLSFLSLARSLDRSCALPGRLLSGCFAPLRSHSQSQDVIARERHPVRLERVALRTRNELDLVVGADLETAVAVKYRFHGFASPA